MEQDSQDKQALPGRRVKVVDATEHRSGTLRAAVKPKKRPPTTPPTARQDQGGRS